MSSSLAKKVSGSLSVSLFVNGFHYRLQSLRHHPLRFASSAASDAYSREPYKPKPKPIQQSATKTPQKVSLPSSTSISYSKKLNEKPKTTNNEQEWSEEEWDDEPQWFKELEIDEEPSAQDLPELEMEGVDWQKIRPTEYRNGEIVYKIIDNPGEKKITLLRECGNGERIKLVAKMPEDGHSYDDRYIYTFVSVKNGNVCGNFDTYSRGGNYRPLKLSCQTKSNDESEEDEEEGYSYCYPDYPDLEYCRIIKSKNNLKSEDFLRKRGIDESLVSFLQEYIIKKFLKEKLFPNIKRGW